MRSCLACLTGALVFALAACGGGGEKAAPPQAAPATSAAAPAAAAPTGAAEFGVPECDEYLNEYSACVDSKVPEAMRGTVRQQLEQTKAAWKQAASTPQGKAGLAMGCKQALETAKTAMAAYGCQWGKGGAPR